MVEICHGTNVLISFECPTPPRVGEYVEVDLVEYAVTRVTWIISSRRVDESCARVQVEPVTSSQASLDGISCIR